MLRRILRFFYRPADFNIGPIDDIYLRRWYVIPRNRFFNIYLHQALRSDDDRALHDHPWWNLSIVLKGGYWEIMPMYRPLYPDLAIDVMLGAPAAPYQRIWRRPGAFIFRRPTDAHRLELSWRYNTNIPHRQYPIAIPSWSLFITGPKLRTWGFWCAKGWVEWEKFVKVVPGGNEVGAGCGE